MSIASAGDQIWHPLPLGYTRILRSKGPVSFYMSCKMEITKVPPPDSTGSYHALSYVWGSAGPDEKLAVPVKINDVPTKIYPSLHAALMAIWNEDPSAPVWADALCINQSNTAEKSIQIAMMSTIYKGAHTVDVWLGKLGALDREPMWRAWQVIKMESSNTGMSLPEIAQTVYPEEYDWRPALVNSMLLLSQNPWFWRVWTAQEILFARSAMVRLGHLSMEWTTFDRGCRSIIRELNTKASMRDPWADIASCGTIITAVAPKLSDLLIATHHRRSTEPKDKIFSLLSLLPEGTYKADYTKDLDSVELQAAIHCIIQEKSLKILELARGFEAPWNVEDTDEELPDWAIMPTNFKENAHVYRYASTKEQYESYYWSDYVKDHPWQQRPLSWVPDFANQEKLLERMISNFRSRLVPRHRPPVLIRTARDDRIGLAGFVLGTIYQCRTYVSGPTASEGACWHLVPITGQEIKWPYVPTVLRKVLSSKSVWYARETDNVDVLEALGLWWSGTYRTSLRNKERYRPRCDGTFPDSRLKHIPSGMPPDAYDGDWICILPGADKLCILRPYVREIVNETSLKNIFQGWNSGSDYRIDKFRFMGMIQAEICDELTEEWREMRLVWANFMLM